MCDNLSSWNAKDQIHWGESLKWKEKREFKNPVDICSKTRKKCGHTYIIWLSSLSLHTLPLCVVVHVSSLFMIDSFIHSFIYSFYDIKAFSFKTLVVCIVCDMRACICAPFTHLMFLFDFLVTCCVCACASFTINSVFCCFMCRLLILKRQRLFIVCDYKLYVNWWSGAHSTVHRTTHIHTYRWFSQHFTTWITSVDYRSPSR